MKPTIVEMDDPCRDAKIYSLEVTRQWLMSEKYPRLKLVWWIIKMAWRAGGKGAR